MLVWEGIFGNISQNKILIFIYIYIYIYTCTCPSYNRNFYYRDTDNDQIVEKSISINQIQNLLGLFETVISASVEMYENVERSDRFKRELTAASLLYKLLLEKKKTGNGSKNHRFLF